jgi:hypothetical protein
MWVGNRGSVLSRYLVETQATSVPYEASGSRIHLIILFLMGNGGAVTARIANNQLKGGNQLAPAQRNSGQTMKCGAGRTVCNGGGLTNMQVETEMVHINVSSGQHIPCSIGAQQAEPPAPQKWASARLFTRQNYPAPVPDGRVFGPK